MNARSKLLYMLRTPKSFKCLVVTPTSLSASWNMARRKYKICVSMQRYASSPRRSVENTEFLLRAYPDLPNCLS